MNKARWTKEILFCICLALLLAGCGGQKQTEAGSKPVQQEKQGRRLRAILALGSQDIGDAAKLTPLDAGVEILGCSSDHTVVDITDFPGTLSYGDTLSFAMGYSAMLYAFSGKHVSIRFTE